MWNTPNVKKLAESPKLYSNDSQKTPLANTLIHHHFFIGNCDWFVAEYDGEDLFWGYTNLGDDEMSEWGYFSFQELRELTIHKIFEVDFDPHWQVRPAREIKKIIHK